MGLSFALPKECPSSQEESTPESPERIGYSGRVSSPGIGSPGGEKRRGTPVGPGGSDGREIQTLKVRVRTDRTPTQPTVVQGSPPVRMSRKGVWVPLLSVRPAEVPGVRWGRRGDSNGPDSTTDTVGSLVPLTGRPGRGLCRRSRRRHVTPIHPSKGGCLSSTLLNYDHQWSCFGPCVRHSVRVRTRVHGLKGVTKGVRSPLSGLRTEISTPLLCASQLWWVGYRTTEGPQFGVDSASLCWL